jgi:cytochrome c-type biogenesis protein CcmH/NrfG
MTSTDPFPSIDPKDDAAPKRGQRERPQARPGSNVRVRPRVRTRRTRSQWLFASIAIIVVLSMVGSVVASIAIDWAGNRQTQTQEDEARGFEDQQEELIAEQREIVAANPNDTAAMVRLAKSLALANQSEEAITWYERALQINPNDVQTRLDFAQMLVQSGNQADAELQYQRVLSLDPNNVQAIFYLGDAYQYWQPQPRTAEAIARFQQVLAVSPDSVLATTARERLTLLGAGTPVPGTPPATPVPVSTPIAGG